MKVLVGVRHLFEDGFGTRFSSVARPCRRLPPRQATVVRPAADGDAVFDRNVVQTILLPLPEGGKFITGLQTDQSLVAGRGFLV